MSIHASKVGYLPDYAEMPGIVLRSADNGGEITTSVDVLDLSDVPWWGDNIRLRLNLFVEDVDLSEGNSYAIELFTTDNLAATDAPARTRFAVAGVGSQILNISTTVLGSGRWLCLRTLVEGDSAPLINYSLNITEVTQ